MIKFTVVDKKLRIEIDTDLNFTIWGYRNCKDDELYAKLIRDHVSKKLARNIERIRKEEYENGWRDKTKRKPKQIWFKSWF